MPETPQQNDKLDPRGTLSIKAFRQAHSSHAAPFWELFVHGHPGKDIKDYEIDQCPSPADLRLLKSIDRDHPGHIGGILTTAPSPFIFRLQLYRLGPEGIDLNQLTDNYPAANYYECIDILGQAGLRTARIVYSADDFRWYGEPEKLFA